MKRDDQYDDGDENDDDDQYDDGGDEQSDTKCTK